MMYDVSPPADDDEPEEEYESLPDDAQDQVHHTVVQVTPIDGYYDVGKNLQSLRCSASSDDTTCTKHIQGKFPENRFVMDIKSEYKVVNTHNSHSFPIATLFVSLVVALVKN
jgi:hypothetical protein